MSNETVSSDTTRDMLRPSQVSQTIGVSARTIQRHEDALREVGSVKTASGWRIPADQVETLAALIATPRAATQDVSQKPVRRRATHETATPSTTATHEACRTTENGLRVELAEAKALVDRHEATITELRAQVADLTNVRDTLLDQQAKATAAQAETAAANAAMALSLRETVQRLEAGSSKPSSLPPETNEAPHHTGTGLRTRFARLFS